MMPVVNAQERDGIPNWDQIESFTERDFAIHEVNVEDEVLWVELDDGRHISFILEHVDPDSDLGSTVQQLPDHNYVTMSAIRLKRGSGYIPRWYVTGISNVRSSEGAERNMFER